MVGASSFRSSSCASDAYLGWVLLALARCPAGCRTEFPRAAVRKASTALDLLQRRACTLVQQFAAICGVPTAALPRIFDLAHRLRSLLLPMIACVVVVSGLALYRTRFGTPFWIARTTMRRVLACGQQSSDRELRARRRDRRDRVCRRQLLSPFCHAPILTFSVSSRRAGGRNIRGSSLRADPRHVPAVPTPSAGFCVRCVSRCHHVLRSGLRGLPAQRSGRV